MAEAEVLHDAVLQLDLSIEQNRAIKPSSISGFAQPNKTNLD